MPILDIIDPFDEPIEHPHIDLPDVPVPVIHEIPPLLHDIPVLDPIHDVPVIQVAPVLPGPAGLPLQWINTPTPNNRVVRPGQFIKFLEEKLS